METVEEDQEYNYREVLLPSLIPIVPQPELERETGERRRGRDILIAVDHGPNSKYAFDWALIHFCRIADTLHLVNAVKCVARIVEGDAGKVICREADRIKPAAVVMGTRGRSIMQSVLQGSVSEYCFHHCKAAPVIVVPGKAEAGDESLI
ncbi:hypothetical protein SLEP1_g31155 [Rubroshorea leprosula]|uniref:UspA domain-containing protein n=1 Tax=Rubroshorea leprosula TaxID=152421 RepID=A0AAV5K4U8_9ROSI|nr:hypothetical protein SLEP1_g31155 [Rubroshorea leprosula]